MEGVGIEKIVKKLQLKKYIEDMELKGHRIRLADVNRPALQLSGYFEHFEQSRVQIIGMVGYENALLVRRHGCYQGWPGQGWL